MFYVHTATQSKTGIQVVVARNSRICDHPVKKVATDPPRLFVIFLPFPHSPHNFESDTTLMRSSLPFVKTPWFEFGLPYCPTEVLHRFTNSLT